MFVVGNLIAATAQIVDMIITVYAWMIIIRALLSWAHPDPFNPVIQLLDKATEPALGFIRRLLPFVWRSGLDFSPVIALLLLMFLKSFLVRTLLDVSLRLR